jgi:hypothetical protein
MAVMVALVLPRPFLVHRSLMLVVAVVLQILVALLELEVLVEGVLVV